VTVLFVPARYIDGYADFNISARGAVQVSLISIVWKALHLSHRTMFPRRNGEVHE